MFKTVLQSATNQSRNSIEPWQEGTLPDLIFTIYLWSHGLRVVDVQRITNISKRNLMFFKDSAKVAATSYSKILKHLEETIEIFLLKLTSLKCITPNG